MSEERQQNKEEKEKILAGKVALITGASRGIGAAMLRAFGNAGAIVAGTATSEAGVKTIEAAIAQGGYRGAAIAMDAANGEQIEAAAKRVADDFGGADILVNNAGIARDNLMLRMSDDDWRAVQSVNLEAAFRLSRRVLRGMMKKRAGCIINISSVVAALGNAGQVNYCASKAGLEGLTRALAREVGARAITVNAIAPGFIDTDMTRALPESVREELCKRIPLGRIGSAKDIAAAAVFIASPAAAYITGQTLHIDGGLWMGG
jgi:3-oxoacyl-[acyl-carrier protein] reductase